MCGWKSSSQFTLHLLHVHVHVHVADLATARSLERHGDTVFFRTKSELEFLQAEQCTGEPCSYENLLLGTYSKQTAQGTTDWIRRPYGPPKREIAINYQSSLHLLGPKISWGFSRMQQHHTQRQMLNRETTEAAMRMPVCKAPAERQRTLAHASALAHAHASALAHARVSHTLAQACVSTHPRTRARHPQ